MTSRLNIMKSIQKVSLLLSLIIVTPCTYTMKLTIPKKVTPPKKTVTHLIPSTLSQDAALMIKQLYRSNTPLKTIAAKPVTITQKPVTTTIKSAAVKAIIAAKSAKAAPAAKATKATVGAKKA